MVYRLSVFRCQRYSAKRLKIWRCYLLSEPWALRAGVLTAAAIFSLACGSDDTSVGDEAQSGHAIPHPGGESAPSSGPDSECFELASTLCNSACPCSGAGSCNLNQEHQGLDRQYGFALSSCIDTLSSRLCSGTSAQLSACRDALNFVVCEQDDEWRAVRVSPDCSISGTHSRTR